MTTESQNETSGTPIKTVTLKHPYNFGEKKITQCIFERRPRAKDIKGLALAKQMADDQYILLGRITNLTTPEIEYMDLEDVMIVMGELESFLPDSLKTGKT